MSYLIATDSRKRDEILFMVDRAKQRASFWSNQTGDAMIFADKAAAERKAKSLRFNNPRVVTLSDAYVYDMERQQAQMHMTGMDAAEDGWDGHKP